MQEQDFEDDIISEGAEYSPKSDFNKGKLTEDAVRKCIEARGKEMKSGYFNTKLTKEGAPIREWISDTRKIYVGTVIALKSILTPELNLEEYKGIKDKLKKIEDKKKEVWEKYCYVEKVKQKSKVGALVWKETGKKIMPEIDDFVVIANPNKTGSALEGAGYWNAYVNAYWNEMVDLHDEIFSILNQLINELNYFKQKIGW